MIPLTILAVALAAMQAPAPATVRCAGVVVPISGLRAADLEDDAVAALRRFARTRQADDPRTRYVIFAPYGWDRGTTSNIDTTRLRGETVRAHLVAAGLPEERIRVIRLGEQGDYPFPPTFRETWRAFERPGNRADRWTSAASVTVELPPGASGC